MTGTSIFACRDARGSQWQLGSLPPAHGRLTLLGWSQEHEEVDAGVPAAVAGVLARALTSTARVTFPCSFAGTGAAHAWTPWDGDLVRALTGRGLAARIAAKLTGTPQDITLICTRRPDTAQRLFDDAGFPWWMQGQVAMLSEPESPPPDLDEDRVLALFGEDWADHAASLVLSGIEGIVRPGVDGDVAGLLTLTDAFDRAMLAGLEKETRGAGLEWSVVSEEEFTRGRP